MFGKFNDENYDGIVLKIPSWFIKVNNFHPAIEALKKSLEECELSTSHPDYVNNIYEIYNLDKKMSILRKRKELAELSKQKQEKYLQDLQSEEIYELDWINEKQYLHHECIRVGKEQFEWDDYFTPKLNIKAEFDRKVHSLTKTWDEFKEFANNNCPMLLHHLQYRNQEILPLDYSFFTTTNASVGISYKHLGIKTNWRVTKNNKLAYSLDQLIIHPDGCYGINAGGNFEDYKRLEGFTRKGMRLIKIK